MPIWIKVTIIVTGVCSIWAVYVTMTPIPTETDLVGLAQEVQNELSLLRDDCVSWRADSLVWDPVMGDGHFAWIDREEYVVLNVAGSCMLADGGIVTDSVGFVGTVRYSDGHWAQDWWIATVGDKGYELR